MLGKRLASILLPMTMQETLNVKQIRKYCKLLPECSILLKNAVERLSLLARANDRILKISRTIADLECVAEISTAHISKPYNTEV
jgi:magnesium chelatase family protein